MTRHGDRHRPGYTTSYQKEVYDDLRIRVRKDSGIKEAIQEASARNHMSVNEYVIQAIVMKLEIDAE